MKYKVGDKVVIYGEPGIGTIVDMSFNDYEVEFDDCTLCCDDDDLIARIEY